jgi:hypothetical protein
VSKPQAPAHAAKPAPSTAKKHAAAPAHKAHKPAAKPAKPAHAPVKAPGQAARPKLPTGVSATILPVVRALGQNHVVVLFFSQSGSADDALTGAGVQSLKGRKDVAVFNAGIEQLAAYRPILSNVGVSQVPAVVIVRPGRKAQLLEGFIDKDSLRQAVADALR